MNLKSCLLLLMLGSAFAQYTYYGSSSKYLENDCCEGKIASSNPKVNWEKNLLCNGDFEKPQIQNGKTTQQCKDIPCWSSTRNIELTSGVYDKALSTQVLDLDSGSNGVSVSQKVDLYEGKFQLRFDYSPKPGQPLQQSSFNVLFNGIRILEIFPDVYGVTTVIHTVNGRFGSNTLVFMENGLKKNIAVGIDNVGLYEWKDNCRYTGEKKSEFKPKNIEQVQAVGAGFPVQFSSSFAWSNQNYQLDTPTQRGNFPTWSAKNNNLQQWIQVSGTEPKKWNSVIIQGRPDYDQWVTSFKLEYTLNGLVWFDYQNGKIFKGSSDRNTKMRHNLKPFYALTLRLVPTAWKNHISLRWGATFLVE